MASQTGTLKFRQSDGTYTDLYPKTTIAQVDGLQTQLNTINTSLQNKVEFFSYGDRSADVWNLYLGYTNSTNTNYGHVGFVKDSPCGYFAVTDNENDISTVLRLYAHSSFNNVAAIRVVVNGEYQGEQYLATCDYVDTKIIEAINSLY